MSSILHVHDTVVADPSDPLGAQMSLKTTTVSMEEQSQMNKHIGKIVCKMWEGQRYHGRVVSVVYHDVYARWMYVAQYTDGDREDYWRNELGMVLCTCTDIQDEDVLV